MIWENEIKKVFLAENYFISQEITDGNSYNTGEWNSRNISNTHTNLIFPNLLTFEGIKVIFYLCKIPHNLNPSLTPPALTSWK